MATRLDATATAAVLIGGATGDQLVALLANEQIPTAAIPIVGSARETFTVVETTTHRQYRLVLSGPTIARTEFAAAAEQIVALAKGIYRRARRLTSARSDPARCRSAAL